MRRSLLKGRGSLITACVCGFGLMAGTAYAQKVIATIPMQNGPTGVAVDPLTKKAFVAINSGVDVIDETTNTVTGFIAESGAIGVSANPATGVLYIGAQNNGLYAVDEKTGSQLGFANVNAVSIAVNLATNVVWVSDFYGTVYAVDGKTMNINASIPVEALENVAVNPATNRVYAAQDLFPGRVTVIDGKTNQVIANPTGGGDLSFDVGVDPVRNIFYSTDQFGTLSVFDGKTNTLVATVTLPGQPCGISVDPRTHKIYVSDAQSSNVYVVDETTNTMTGTITVGSSPLYSAVDPARELVYVANTGQSDNYAPGSETVSVIKE